MIDWYTPAYKAGGPIQSCRNLVQVLSVDYDFYICTGDRDLGDKQPFAGIGFDQWVEDSPGVKVWYTSATGSTKRMKHLIADLDPDVVYLNSMFSVRFTLLPLWVLHAMRFNGKVIIAPRGMLHAGARSFKAWKKSIFLFLFNRYNKRRQFTFQATDPQEAADIRQALPTAMHIATIGNIPSVDIIKGSTCLKRAGELRLIFLSRIHPKKDLLGLIRLLSRPFNGKLSLDIYGSTDDEAYAEQCREAARKKGEGVTIHFKGPIPHQDVASVLQSCHLFALLTKGENFGHAIFESLCCGVPVFISPHTPWKGLQEAHAGWAVDPADTRTAMRILDEVLQMDQESFSAWREGALSYAEAYIQNSHFKNDYSNLFSQ